MSKFKLKNLIRAIFKKEFKLNVNNQINNKNNNYIISENKISNKKYKIHEIPINYKGRSYKQGKKISSADGLDALYCLIKYKFF